MGTYVKDGNSCIGCTLLEEFPGECNGCHNLKSEVDLIQMLIEKDLPEKCTPEQWEEITGETFPDAGVVSCLYYGTKKYKHIGYGRYKDFKHLKNMFIVQTGKPAPKTEWRPG